MDDAVAKGYQAAITTLSGGPCGRLILSSQRYPGRTKSAECLRAAVLRMASAVRIATSLPAREHAHEQSRMVGAPRQHGCPAASRPLPGRRRCPER